MSAKVPMRVNIPGESSLSNPISSTHMVKVFFYFQISAKEESQIIFFKGE